MRVLAVTESGQSHRFRSAEAFEAWRLHAAPGKLRVVTLVEVNSESSTAGSGPPLPALGPAVVPAS